MSNTHNRRQVKNAGYNAAKQQDLPPFSLDRAQNTLCATARLYLAVWDDLTPQQRRLVSNHLHLCEHCAHVQHLFQGVTRSITSLPETQPSAQVDRAVFDVIAANTRPGGRKNKQLASSLRSQTQILPHPYTQLRRRFTGVMTLLALVLLVLAYLWTNRSLTPENFQLLLNHLYGWLQFLTSQIRHFLVL